MEAVWSMSLALDPEGLSVASYAVQLLMFHLGKESGDIFLSVCTVPYRSGEPPPAQVAHVCPAQVQQVVRGLA